MTSRLQRDESHPCGSHPSASARSDVSCPDASTPRIATDLVFAAPVRPLRRRATNRACAAQLRARHRDVLRQPDSMPIPAWRRVTARLRGSTRCDKAGLARPRLRRATGLLKPWRRPIRGRIRAERQTCARHIAATDLASAVLASATFPALSPLCRPTPRDKPCPPGTCHRDNPIRRKSRRRYWPTLRCPTRRSYPSRTRPVQRDEPLPPCAARLTSAALSASTARRRPTSMRFAATCQRDPTASESRRRTCPTHAIATERSRPLPHYASRQAIP